MDSFSGFGKALMLMGGALFALGLVLAVLPRVPFLGRLPGDILFRNDNTTVFIPLTTMLLVSLALTLILNVLPRIFR